MMRAMTVVLAYAPIAILLALWEAASRLGAVSADLLPPVSAIAASWWDLVLDGDLARHAAASLLRTLAGLVLAVIVGLALGIGLAVSPLAERLLQPVLAFLYPLPKSALIPVLLVWLGFGHPAQIAIIFLGCLLPVLLSAFNGARGVDRVLIWSARSLGSSRAATLWNVVIPAALPDVLAGTRTALGLCFVLLVSSEMIGAREGMGFLIQFLGEGGNYAAMFAAVFTVIAFGFVADRLYLALTRRLLRWREA